MIKDTLFIIPARGGSKGIPRKNITPINGKPLIYYTIDAARGVTNDGNICVSTDNTEIKGIVEDYGLNIPFIRPSELSTDLSGSKGVLIHAIDFYKMELKKDYSYICLLQPTSPFRNSKHINEAFQLWNDDLDMVVSVKESKANPYFNLFEETETGFLKKSKSGSFLRRQDSPATYEMNGGIYIIKQSSLKKYNDFNFPKVKKYLMNDIDSIDIDNNMDLEFVKFLMK